MVLCCVPNCHRRSEDHPELQFFRFTRNKKVRSRWINQIRRKIDRNFTCSVATRICSWHFPAGKEAGPMRFAWNEAKLMMFKDPERGSIKVRTSKPATLTNNHLVLPDNSSNPEVPKDLQSNNELQPQHSCLLPDACHAEDILCSYELTNQSGRETGNESECQGGEYSSAVFDETSERSPDGMHETSERSPDGMHETRDWLEEAEIYLLRSENESLKKKMKKRRFSFMDIARKPKMITFYTCLPDRATFEIICKTVSRFRLQYHDNWKVSIIPMEDQILLTMMKMRLNLRHMDLAQRFNISMGSVSNIFQTMVDVMHEIFFKGMMASIPSRAKNQMDLPECFRDFRNTRIILDCTEVEVDKPEELGKNCSTFSHYKKRNTLKGLVGIAPNGTITFSSDLYGGHTSDRMITQDCGVLRHMDVGDIILADKGFTIGDILPVGVAINHPSFLVNGQFTKCEVEQNKKLSKARVHVERAIQRIKLYDILVKIPHQYRDISSKIFQLSCCFANFQNPVICHAS